MSKKPLENASSVLNLFEDFSPLDFQNFFRSSLAEKIRKRDFGVQEKWTTICNDGSVEKIAITVPNVPYFDETEEGFQVRCWAEKDGHGGLSRGHVDSGSAKCAMLFEFRLPDVRTCPVFLLSVNEVVSALSNCGINPPPGFVVKTENISQGNDSATKITFVKNP